MRIYFEYEFPQVPLPQERVLPFWANGPNAKEDAAELHSQLEIILIDLSRLSQLQNEDNRGKIRDKAREEMKKRMWYILKRLSLADEFKPIQKNDDQSFSF